MMGEMGIEKGALGIRYLLKYLENGKIENFSVVKNCLEEVRLWVLITLFCSNMDALIESIPNEKLKDVFLQKNLMIGKSYRDCYEIDYGRGFKSNSSLSYKEQFVLIRNALCHGCFTINNGLITVKLESGFEAVFDIEWLNNLALIFLSNNKITLSKGMSDISIISFINNDDISIEQFKSYIEQGIIKFCKITSLTSNQETIGDAFRISKDDYDCCTFDFVFHSVIGLIQKYIYEVLYNGMVDKNNIITANFKIIEQYLNNRIKIELIPISLPDELISDEEFINLDFKSKLECLINKVKLNNPISYNSICAFYILELLNDIKDDKFTDKTLFVIKDARNFLLKAYANVACINTYIKASPTKLDNYGVRAKFVYGKNVYQDYLRVLQKSLNELEENDGPGYAKNYMKGQIKIYSKFLNEVLDNDIYKDFFWKVRNALVHNQVEFKDDIVRFYTTGRNINLKHFSKKKKTWENKEFCNTKPIWEMTINKDMLLNLMDDLLEAMGIEVKVNISRYVKRREYNPN